MINRTPLSTIHEKSEIEGPPACDNTLSFITTLLANELETTYRLRPQSFSEGKCYEMVVRLVSVFFKVGLNKYRIYATINVFLRGFAYRGNRQQFYPNPWELEYHDPGMVN